MSIRLSKIRSVHTYVMTRTVYFGWICIKYSDIIILQNFHFIFQEVLCQTKFLTKVLATTPRNCCSQKFEIFFPSLSKLVLSQIIQFLYHGEVVSKCDEIYPEEILENLVEIFGFPDKIIAEALSSTKSDTGWGFENFLLAHIFIKWSIYGKPVFQFIFGIWYQIIDIFHHCFSKFPHLSLNQGLQMASKTLADFMNKVC